MIFFRRVAGTSMQPTLRAGDVVVCRTRTSYSLNDIVVAYVSNREVVKRIMDVRAGRYFLSGDNQGASTDSRHYGFVNESAIIGRIMIVFPKSRPAPKLRHRYGAYFGWGAAVLLIIFAVVHLFRIDTFIPALDEALPGGKTIASWAAVGIILVEIFALPFLMRMKLSPLAQYKSGALSVVAPLIWLLIAIWNVGLGTNTGQLGGFHELQSSIALIIVNFIWLGYGYLTLWSLGYDEGKISLFPNGSYVKSPKKKK